MGGLSEVPMNELLREILRRPQDMYESEYLGNEAFDLADIIATRVCVDGAPVRHNEQDQVELMAIHRNTGPYSGKLCLVGGGVGRVREDDKWQPESFEEALRRHFRTDLGFEIEPVTSWEEPQFLAQDMRPIDGEIRPGFTPNPNSRHLVAARFLVCITSGEDTLTFGSTEKGGQEADGVSWFNEEKMPDDSSFGYGMSRTYKAMFRAAKNLLS